MDYFEEKTFNNDSFFNLQPYKSSEFISCSFEHIDFTTINLSMSKFVECKFSKCNLSNISLKNSTFRDVIFSECKLMGLNWSETQTLMTPIFNESLLDFSVFQALKLNSAVFKNCSIKEVDFYQASLNKV